MKREEESAAPTLAIPTPRDPSIHLDKPIYTLSVASEILATHPRTISKKNLSEALGDALAQEICSDRDYPPFDRSTRDGYAVRAADATQGADLRCTGEIKAGDTVTSPLNRWTCVQIMTGAAVPAGAAAFGNAVEF